MRKLCSILLAAVAAVLLFHSASYAQADQGSVCIFPVLRDNPDQTGMTSSGNMACAEKDYQLRFDQHKAFAWPTKESLEIDDLDPSSEHKIFVSCGQKQIQTLTLRLSSYKTTQLALTIYHGQTHLWTSLYSYCVEAEESKSKLSKKD